MNEENMKKVETAFWDAFFDSSCPPTIDELKLLMDDSGIASNCKGFDDVVKDIDIIMKENECDIDAAIDSMFEGRTVV